jgi:hypothetical protein
MPKKTKLPAGFTLVSEREIKGQGMKGSLFRHDCGLEVLCLETSDIENLFAICLKTVPEDSTGVPHIIEHSVLCGSQKYPVKDPFIEMVKCSMATFINAMTYSDRTVYPAASCNAKDFFNLLSVYWDAVFHPLITREAFSQEGWHYDFLDKGRKKLTANGVVFNEMSGYYADFDTILERSVFKYLFPETSLKYDSGGDPADITDLTYEQYLDYYRRHYVPGRAKVLMYGNIPTADKLSFLADRLKEQPIPRPRGRQPAHSRQPRWKTARCQREFFLPECAEDKRGALVLNWFIDDKRDPELDLAMQLLDFLLCGNAGAPINKTLMSCGLGTAMIDGGFDNSNLETAFQIGLRGVLPENFDKVEELIVDCLASLVRDGIGDEQLQTAISELRVDQQEIQKLHCLDIMEDVLSAWNYGKDPLCLLDNRANWEQLKKKLETKPGYLEWLIRKYLLENPHRLRLELCPDPQLAVRRKEELAAKMKERRQAMNKQDLQRLEAENAARENVNSRVNTPEQLATLPRLSTGDLRPEPPFPLKRGDSVGGKVPIARGEAMSSGLTYARFCLDLTSLPARFWPVMGLLTTLFGRLGTKRMSYDELARKQALYGSKGLKITSILSNVRAGGLGRGPVCLLGSFRSLQEYFTDASALSWETWNELDFHETERIMQVLKQKWTSITENYTHSRGEAIIRAGAGISELMSLGELFSGWTAVEALKSWKELQGAKLSEMQALLTEMMQWLRHQHPLCAIYLGGDEQFASAEQFLQKMYQSKSNARSAAHLPVWQEAATGRRELLKVNGSVASCARVIRAPGADDLRMSALKVAAHLLTCGYLWSEVRGRNGAYGVGALYSYENRCLAFFSSEDPHPEDSLKLFAKLPSLGLEKHWSQTEIDGAIIAVAKREEAPWTAASLTQEGICRLYGGYDDEFYRKHRQCLLSLTPKTLAKAVQEIWEEYGQEGNEAAIGPARLFSSDWQARTL